VEEATVLAIRDERWKLIDRSQRPGAHPMPAPPKRMNSQAEANGKTMEQLHMPGAVSRPTAPLELYDLQKDPGETTNVANAHPEIVERLRKKLAEIRAQGHS
jgi:hypothetical protein